VPGGPGVIGRLPAIWVLVAMLGSSIAAEVESRAPTPRYVAAPWYWETGDVKGKSLRISLVRGSVRIVRRAGRVRIALLQSSAVASSAFVTMVVDEGADLIAVVDRYPGQLNGSAECLPPLTARGNFWASDVRVEAVVYAPDGFPIEVDVMALRAERPHG
jgi:hypothetical protein